MTVAPGSPVEAERTMTPSDGAPPGPNCQTPTDTRSVAASAPTSAPLGRHAPPAVPPAVILITHHDSRAVDDRPRGRRDPRGPRRRTIGSPAGRGHQPSPPSLWG